jgi:HEPN domain-containing protein
MKPITSDWLKSAETDLLTVTEILENPALTTVVAFHAQQCIEKVFKALIEEHDLPFARTHDLLTLKGLTDRICPLAVDEDLLSLLNKLYIDARYPGELGLLPTGRPSIDDAHEFHQIAYEVIKGVKSSSLTAHPQVSAC